MLELQPVGTVEGTLTTAPGTGAARDTLPAESNQPQPPPKPEGAWPGRVRVPRLPRRHPSVAKLIRAVHRHAQDNFLLDAVRAFSPDLVMHQLTDLPDQRDEIAGYAKRSNRIRPQRNDHL